MSMHLTLSALALPQLDASAIFVSATLFLISMEASNLTIRIPVEIKEALKKKAEEEGRNVTEVLMQFIGEYLKRQESTKQASLEKRLSRLEYVVEQKLEASLGELAA